MEVTGTAVGYVTIVGAVSYDLMLGAWTVECMCIQIIDKHHTYYKFYKKDDFLPVFIAPPSIPRVFAR